MLRKILALALLGFALTAPRAARATAPWGKSTYTLQPRRMKCSGSPIRCDLTRELQRILYRCDRKPPYHDPANRVGCVIKIPPGLYDATETFYLYRGHVITGEDSGGFWANSTQIKWPGAVTGFVFASNTEAVAAGRGAGGGGGVIKNLTLESVTGTSTTVPSYGIEVRDARTLIKNVYIKKFVQGVRISADINLNTNGNTGYMEKMRIQECEHAGIFADGGDANAILGVAIDTSGNCADQAVWNSQISSVSEECANLLDSGFLGNTWVGIHTSTCDGGACPGYIFEGNSSRSACFGCYAENNQALAKADQLVGWWGGIGLFDAASNGAKFEGRFAYALEVINDGDPNNVVRAKMGRHVGNGTALQVKANQDAWGVELARQTNPDGWWAFQAANSSAHTGLRFWIADNGTTHDLMRLWLYPKGVAGAASGELLYGTVPTCWDPLGVNGGC